MHTEILEDELADLKTKALFRRLRVLGHPSPVRAVLDGKELLLFCSNDYLGFSSHPRVVRASGYALKKYGIGARASRLISGTTDLHQELEEKLAWVKGTQRALVFSAGYLANLGVLSAIADKSDLIVLDKLCHASLIDACRLSGAAFRVFPHKNYDKCEELLKNAESNFRRLILVSDSLFSMDGDLADLEKLVELKERYGAVLVIDDAHATGVLGAKGGGAAEDGGLQSRIDIITGTLSKALGCLGGFAATNDSWADYLINRSRPFIFSTALPPHLCAAALEGLRLFEEEPEWRFRLWQNIQRLHEGLKGLGWELGPITSPILPLVVGEEKKALSIAEGLLNQGLLVPAIRYPTVAKHKARLRLTVSAMHREEDICSLLRAIENMEISPNFM